MENFKESGLERDIYNKLVIELLSLLNIDEDEDILERMINLVKEHTGFGAVGIRFKQGENFPYHYHLGFSNSFIEKENSLFVSDQSRGVIRDCNNDIKLACLCGAVLNEETNPSLPFYNEHGSFFTNSTSELVAKFKDDLPSSARAHCANEGYKTIAIVPIRTENETIGTLQLNDKQEGLLNPNKIKNLEAVGNILGIIYQRRQYENDLRKSQKELKTALVKQNQEFLKRKRNEKKLERKKEELEYNKLKTKFFANMSHELKTPLNLIFSSLQMLNLYQEKNLNQEHQDNLTKYTKTIKQNANRLLRLANNILDITKIDIGAFNLKLQNINIINVVKRVSDSVKDYIESNGKVLKVNLDIEEKIIACDPIKIERILLNLLSNAVKFTDQGDTITVSTSLGEEGDNVIISVKDTGIGMKEDKQQVIFEEFRQIDETFSRNVEGTGIGLSIVKSLVELHDGQISLNSEVNKGSEFTIKLSNRTLSAEESDQYYNYEDSLDRVEIEFSDIYD
ncbi:MULTISPECIES: GAF domain-containing sensor histidine kinase [unclassified Candidatus Frackibacter]|uniref:GAF domain-containing sensor histidine kinase n=1 Tax=unclassified Candidatus Frackibacter TaxID=2648818 RepID=UPI00088000A1|nr:MULTISPECIES: GAF domain-containing sensor histidine kinase [unclassified Candidatus Frackibacter]SDC62273.1 His Kinase A (phospho-acceptor) domain-containing protein [Candidatus Frackibacter sp. WG11]SEM76048.1 His Kinase A (phospho-acceptor) domain-containing protein [Candidatus Frackibacter sp. WG12]SFL86370.1 His Kinase A (phospho-acceptor) domain-containing protein [Candidatus Frackibacter sp. WG13]